MGRPKERRQRRQRGHR